MTTELTTTQATEQANPFDGLLSTVAKSANQTGDIMSKVGVAAGEIVDERGDLIERMCDEAIAEVRAELDVTEGDDEQIKAELKNALSLVLQSQREVPQEAAKLVLRTHKRVKQLMTRSVDTTVGKLFLPVIERVTADITEEDVAAAAECSRKMAALEGLFGIEDDEDGDELPDISPSVAGKVLYQERQRKRNA